MPPFNPWRINRERDQPRDCASLTQPLTFAAWAAVTKQQSDQTQNENNMSTQKAKFELFQRLQNLGFTYEEAVQLRRIEMTLQRWGELECGNDNGRASYCVNRDEVTGKPYMEIHPYSGPMRRYPVADREAGALRRLSSIVEGRNNRLRSFDARRCSFMGHVFAYHQGDPRGCALYLLTRAQLTGHDGKTLPMDQYYTRGVAVCA